MRYERLVLILMILLSAGCSSLDPATIKAMDGMSASVCAQTPGWNGSPMNVHVATFGGKATGNAGGGGKATCGSSVVEFTNEGKVEKQK
jgi:hypothetical protein